MKAKHHMAVFLGSLAVCMGMWVVIPADGSPAHRIVAAIADVDAVFWARFVLSVVVGGVVLILAGRCLVAWMDAQERKQLAGFEQIDVHSSSDLSSLRLMRERTGQLPVAVETWRNPGTGETRRIYRFW